MPATSDMSVRGMETTQVADKGKNEVTHSLDTSLKSLYPPGVPDKFAVDGAVQPFPGNTIVSHLSTTSPLRAVLFALYKKLSHSHLSHLYTLLPPSSWHMTVMEGVCDQVRKPGAWPSDLALDASLEQCNHHFMKKLAKFDLQCDPPYHLSISGFEPLTTGIAVQLKGGSPPEDARLRDLRNRLSNVLQTRAADHETYVFHLSMAYLLRHLTVEEEVELSALLNGHLAEMPRDFELGVPEFCTFEDMFAFDRQMYLVDQDSRHEAGQSGQT